MRRENPQNPISQTPSNFEEMCPSFRGKIPCQGLICVRENPKGIFFF